MLQVQEHDCVNLMPFGMAFLIRLAILQIALVGFVSNPFLQSKDVLCYATPTRQIQETLEFFNNYCRQFSLYVNGPNGKESVE